MSSRGSKILVAVFLAAATGVSSCAGSGTSAAADAPSPQTGDAFAALQVRGEVAMGVDQYASTHQFDALADGGRIELQMDTDDSVGIAHIRQHLREIARVFQAGDFSTPAFVHMQTVPGTTVMAARRDAITYAYRDLPRGGEVRITTRDPEAIQAIHEFMAFQREDHRAGGVEHPDHGGSTAGMDHAAMHGGRGMGAMDHGAMHAGGAVSGGMDPGAHDEAFQADMQLVHELLSGHAAIERTVTPLPNGVRTVTESQNPRLAGYIKEHVTRMLERLESGEVFNVASPTIPVIFANAARITTRIEQTERGVTFTQTTDVGELVSVLQAHAAEVDELVKEGMAAMMRSMMQRSGMPAPAAPRP